MQSLGQLRADILEVGIHFIWNFIKVNFHGGGRVSDIGRLKPFGDALSCNRPTPLLHSAETGEVIIMPADAPHALQAKEAFKMLLIMIRGK